MNPLFFVAAGVAVVALLASKKEKNNAFSETPDDGPSNDRFGEPGAFHQPNHGQGVTLHIHNNGDPNNAIPSDIARIHTDGSGGVTDDCSSEPGASTSELD